MAKLPRLSGKELIKTLSKIGDPYAFRLDAGVGVALGDMDGDGDLDIVTATPNRVEYWENNIPQKNRPTQ